MFDIEKIYKQAIIKIFKSMYKKNITLKDLEDLNLKK